MGEVAVEAAVQLHFLVFPVHRRAESLTVAQTVALRVVRTTHEAELLVSAEAVDVQVAAVSVVGAVGSVCPAE